MTKEKPRRVTDGPAHPVTKEWKVRVQLRMRLRGMSQTDLASEIGVSRAAISFLLTKAKQSSLVPAVEKALGLPSDTALGGRDPSDGNLLREMIVLFGELNEANRGRIVERCRAMLEVQQAESATSEVIQATKEQQKAIQRGIEIAGEMQQLLGILAPYQKAVQEGRAQMHEQVSMADLAKGVADAARAVADLPILREQLATSKSLEVRHAEALAEIERMKRKLL